MKLLGYRNHFKPLLDRVPNSLIAYFVLFVGLSLTAPNFFTQLNLTNILFHATTVGLVAAGTTLVLICGEIDLSIGSVQGLATCVAGVLIIMLGIPWVIAILLILLMGLCIGGINGFLSTRLKMPSFIATLAMLGIAQGLGLVLTGARVIYGFPQQYLNIYQGKIGFIPIPIILVIIVYIVLHYLLKHTLLGLHIFAVGGNLEAAKLAGINVVRIKSITFYISGFCSVMAGILLSGRLNAGSALFGANDLLDAIAAVAIGGTSIYGGIGSMPGTAFGVLIIVTIRNGLNMLNVSTFWQQVAVGILIIAASLIEIHTKQNNHS